MFPVALFSVVSHRVSSLFYWRLVSDCQLINLLLSLPRACLTTENRCMVSNVFVEQDAGGHRINLDFRKPFCFFFVFGRGALLAFDMYA